MFRDRHDAGQQLATRLQNYAGRDDVAVLGLPRGGVPVAYEVAQALRVPLDIFVVRKLGVPGHKELAMGAIASGGVRVLNELLILNLHVPEEMIEEVTARETQELERCEREYRGDRAPLNLRDKVVILIDDGLATGATMRAAVQALRRHEPAQIVIAVPVGPRETCMELRDPATDVVCLKTPDPFLAVGNWYSDFTQTTDETVRGLLTASWHPQ